MQIELSGISKEFKEKVKVLDGLDFSDDVSALAIIGPSGCGKSTLLRIIGGLIQPTCGKLIIDGREVEQREKAFLAYRRQLGFVFQKDGLFHHMRASENIRIPLETIHGFTREAAEERTLALLRQFGLAADGDKMPSELSGGQQQRIAIARAIAPNPKLLLLDEPTSALDPEYTTEVLDMVNGLRREGMQFIIVTHEMGFARHACNKIAFLSNGQISEYGTSEAVFSHPKTAQLQQFLGKLLEWK
ncbi:MAG: ATP-binding cassette domain-containing protein [Anaerovoracaceae bacterium]